MKIYEINGQNYRLPNALNSFQQSLYVHLIDWKWRHITTEPGFARGQAYDAILPERYAGQFPILYPDIVPTVQQHLQAFPFRIHTYFDHMASSQAANLNLFLPVLRHPQADVILRAINPDVSRLATDCLDHGYRIEFWDEGFGNLGDKSAMSGTDADIAIAYYNHRDELCLWLIEHKLTESEFTTCGGYKSPGRTARHDCTQSFAAIVQNKHLCYYHDVRHFHYWTLTDAHQSFFAQHAAHAHCPFQGGMNQLWRNQLLALSIEQDHRQPYRHVSFSVVRHPANHHLDATLTAYQHLIDHSPKFTTFTSANVLQAAGQLGDTQLDARIAWYRDLYQVR